MTQEIRLVLFNKPNMHQLKFNIDIRTIICFLKCGYIRLQKAMLFNFFFFNNFILCYSKQKVKILVRYTWLKILKKIQIHEVSLCLQTA